jgi:hypothetical protein
VTNITPGSMLTYTRECACSVSKATCWYNKTCVLIPSMLMNDSVFVFYNDTMVLRLSAIFGRRWHKPSYGMKAGFALF